MGLALVGVDGPLKDQIFALAEGLTLGRESAGIEIPDPLVSSVHARIYQNEQKNWILADNNSKNGVRLSGERVSFIELKPGVLFKIGEQGFQVVETAESRQATPEPGPEAKEAPRPEKPQKQQRYWHEALGEFLQAHSKGFSDDPQSMTPFHPALVLEFTRGIQVNSRWVLGYGPRSIGADTIDLPIWEPGAPSVCFEINSSLSGIVFKTNHPKIVRLNDQEVDSQVLSVGDTIKIMDTLIEVDFVE